MTVTVKKKNGNVMSREDRIQKALRANDIKKNKAEITGGILKATHTGELVLGDVVIPCAVLEDGSRILSDSGVTMALGSRSGSSIRKRREAYRNGAHTPAFLGFGVINDLVFNKLSSEPPMVVKYKKGRSVYEGYHASILPLLCDAWLEARDLGLLMLEAHKNKAKKAELLIRALAKVGITALVDEATGYQEERNRSELQKLLAKYVREEYLPWQARFPKMFYQQIFRLYGWKFDPSSVKRPALIGKFTNDYVYGKLPEGVLEELRSKNPSDINGNRNLRHHQWLTTDIGIPQLDKHLTGLILLMKASSDIEMFIKLYENAEREGAMAELLLSKPEDTNKVVIEASSLSDDTGVGEMVITEEHDS